MINLKQTEKIRPEKRKKWGIHKMNARLSIGKWRTCIRGSATKSGRKCYHTEYHAHGIGWPMQRSSIKEMNDKKPNELLSHTQNKPTKEMKESYAHTHAHLTHTKFHIKEYYLLRTNQHKDASIAQRSEIWIDRKTMLQHENHKLVCIMMIVNKRTCIARLTIYHFV